MQTLEKQPSKADQHSRNSRRVIEPKPHKGRTFPLVGQVALLFPPPEDAIFK